MMMLTKNTAQSLGITDRTDAEPEHQRRRALFAGYDE